MNEQFDHDLREAMQQGPGGSLKGLEFTPAMRQRVLDRIRTEGTGTVAHPSRTMRTVPRPLLWAAAAAAALVIGIRLDWVQGFMGFQNSASKSAPPMMAGAAQQAQGTKAESTAASAPAMPAPAPGGVPTQDQSPARSSSAQSQSGSAGGSTAMQSSAPASAAPALPVVSLTLPSAQGEAAPKMPAAPATTSALKAEANWVGVTGAGSRSLLVGQGNVAANDAAGLRLWQTDVAGVSSASPAALAEDGRSAVGGSDSLYLLTPAGQVERRVGVTGLVTALSFGPDGRLAVVSGTRLSLYRNGELRTLTEGLAAAEVQVRPDNAIALLATVNGRRTLRLWDAQGSPVFESAVEGSGGGLAVTSAGLLVAGGTVYDAHGTPLRRLPMEPVGTAAPEGTPFVFLWTADQVMAVNPADGDPLWRARWEAGGSGIRQVVAGREAGPVVVTGAAEQGGALFVLAGLTGEVRLRERLVSPPAGAAVLRGQLLLTVDGALVQREIGP